MCIFCGGLSKFIFYFIFCDSFLEVHMIIDFYIVFFLTGEPPAYTLTIMLLPASSKLRIIKKLMK